MVLWPAGLALVVVWFVFKDPAIDYRVVVAGALLPDLFDAPFGGAGALHTLVAAVAVLAVVMGATRGHRHARRRWIFLPVGMFLHLVADGMWTRTTVFWWPFFGASFSGALPAVDHGIAVLVIEEIAGALALGWFWVRFRLSAPVVRANFVRTGRVPRDS
ncbi:MAG: metal-dependent hydrolase [Actinomycetota bacterium]|nr:metal-dependent hydrolase [Actinomycetota bacterium]